MSVEKSPQLDNETIENLPDSSNTLDLGGMTNKIEYLPEPLQIFDKIENLYDIEIYNILTKTQTS